MTFPLDIDYHTHRLDAPAGGAIICLPEGWLSARPEEVEGLRSDAWYSVGVHPWTTADEELTRQLLERLPEWTLRPEVVAIGECGLDALRGGSEELQEAVLTQQLLLAEERGLPVTLHVVRRFDRLLHLRRRLFGARGPQSRWTIHGFRGGPALARRLLEAGMDLSFGLRYNEAAYELTPPERRRRETDAQ